MEVEIYGYKEILFFPFLCVTKATFLHRNDENTSFLCQMWFINGVWKMKISWVYNLGIGKKSRKKAHSIPFSIQELLLTHLGTEEHTIVSIRNRKKTFPEVNIPWY